VSLHEPFSTHDAWGSLFWLSCHEFPFRDADYRRNPTRSGSENESLVSILSRSLATNHWLLDL
jgi:hypothetical protein